MRIKLCIILMALLASPLFAQRLSRDAKEWEDRLVAATPNYWQGVEDWELAASWSLGHIPSAAEAATFDGRSQSTPMVNLDTTSTTCAELITEPEYLADIGSPGNGLDKDIARVTLRGPGKVYLGIDSGQFPDIVLDNANCLLTIDSIVRHLLVKEGDFVVMGTAEFTGELQMYGLYAQGTIEARVGGVSSSPSDISVYGGDLLNKRVTQATAGVYLVSGGTAIQEGIIDVLTKVRVEAGELRYKPQADPSGETPSLFIIGGLFNAKESAFAITTGTVFRGPTAELWGSIKEGPGAWVDIDLSQDHPFQ